MKATKTCIYCGAVGRRFPSEHVIPVAFGKFRNNLTLRTVCGNCNHYFSTNIERPFTRESAEAIARFTWGLRPNEPGRRSDRTSIESTDPTLPGVKIVFASDLCESGFKFVVPPQVGFHSEAHLPTKWFREDEIDIDLLGKLEGVSHATFVARTEVEAERITRKLAQLGVSFGPVENEHTEKTTPKKARVVTTWDVVARRCIAKIAFNYLAYVCTEISLSLDEDFCRTRDFIRYGTEPADMPLVIRTTERLFDTSKPSQRRLGNGHGVSVTWNQSLTGIVAHVVLFGKFNYKVLLAPRFNGTWYPFASAHHFDLTTKEAHKLGIRSIDLPAALGRIVVSS